MPVLNWIRFSEELSWDQASAAAAGGRLYIDDHDPASGANWPQGLADALGDSVRYETPSWFGISAIAGGGYRWVDGRTVDPAWAATRFGPGGDPNADADPSNDAAHLVLAGNTWRSPAEVAPDGVSQAFIEYTNSKSMRGTAFDDAFFGGGGPGETLRTEDGNDSWIGTGGGKVYLGAGDDFASVRELGFTNEWVGAAVVDGTTIFDGFGRDGVEAESAVVRAAIDGEADQFIARRVSYTDATLGVTIVPVSPEGYRATLTLAGGGTPAPDSLTAVEVVGGSGDDHIEGVPRIQGGAGNDYLAPGTNALSQSPYAEGDAGDDTLVGSSVARTELRGGPGDDVLLLSGPAEVSGGAGADRFVFQTNVPVTIGDLGAGDRIDITALTDLNLSQLTSDGYLAVKSGGYTELLFDADGGGDDYVTLANLKGHFLSSSVYDALLLAPANHPPTELRLSPATNTFGASTDLTNGLVAATILVTDRDMLGTNLLSLSGRDAADFEIRKVPFPGEAVPRDMLVYVGPTPDIATQASYHVTVNVDDPAVGSSPDLSTTFTLNVADNPPVISNAVFLIPIPVYNAVRLASATPLHEQGNGDSFDPNIFGDTDPYLTFNSDASNLVPGDTNGVTDRFRRTFFDSDPRLDRVAENTEGPDPPISYTDGRYLFSVAPVGPDLGGNQFAQEVVRKDLTTGETIIVSARADGTPAESPEAPVFLSFGTLGQSVLFYSDAANLVNDADGPNPGGPAGNYYVKDLSNGVLYRVSSNAAGELVSNPTHGRGPSGALGGRDDSYVAFSSGSSSLVAGDHNQADDVFLTDLDALTAGSASAWLFFQSNIPSHTGGRVFIPPTAEYQQAPLLRDFFPTSPLIPIQLLNGESATFTVQVTDELNQTGSASLPILSSIAEGISHPDVVHTLVGGSANELLMGGQGRDSLNGGDGHDALRGGSGDDTLDGGPGFDQIDGGPGADLMSGGEGEDGFFFITPSQGADRITGFSPGGQDHLVFPAQTFGGGLIPDKHLITPPETDGNLFVAASDPFATTLNSSSAFLYDTDDGRLWFDPDGSGTEVAVLIVTLVSAPALGTNDIWIM